MKIELIHILVGLGVLVGFVGVLITIGIIIFKVSGWTHKVNTGVDQVDKFTQITDTIRGDINAIREKIAQIFGLLREPLGRESPLKLTDFGEKIPQMSTLNSGRAERLSF